MLSSSRCASAPSKANACVFVTSAQPHIGQNNGITVRPGTGLTNLIAVLSVLLTSAFLLGTPWWVVH